MLYHVHLSGHDYEVELDAEGVRIDGEPVEASLSRVDGTTVYSLLLDHASHRVIAHALGRHAWQLHLDGARLVAEVVDERTHAIRQMTSAGAGAAGPRPVRAPMPGLVVKVEVEEGDTVRAGQGVVIVEAMKMENELRAEAEGTVARIHVRQGDTVEKDQILIDLDAPEELE